MAKGRSKVDSGKCKSFELLAALVQQIDMYKTTVAYCLSFASSMTMSNLLSINFAVSILVSVYSHKRRVDYTR